MCWPPKRVCTARGQVTGHGAYTPRAGRREAGASERVRNSLPNIILTRMVKERTHEVKPCFTPPFLPLRIRVESGRRDAMLMPSLTFNGMKYDAYAPGSEKVPSTLTSSSFLAPLSSVCVYYFLGGLELKCRRRKLFFLDLPGAVVGIRPRLVALTKGAQ